MKTETEEITQEIKEEIQNVIWIDEQGKEVLRLGNWRLDFSKNYYFKGFTKKGVKLSYLNGTNEINVIGKVIKETDREYKYTLYVEGWNFIERLGRKTIAPEEVKKVLEVQVN